MSSEQLQTEKNHRLRINWLKIAEIVVGAGSLGLLLKGVFDNFHELNQINTDPNQSTPSETQPLPPDGVRPYLDVQKYLLIIDSLNPPSSS